MTRIDDSIAIKYPIDMPIAGIREVIEKYSDLLDPGKHPNPELHRESNNLMRIDIRLNRPDTFNDAEITAYKERVEQFRKELAEFPVLLIVKIASFNVPAPQGP